MTTLVVYVCLAYFTVLCVDSDVLFQREQGGKCNILPTVCVATRYASSTISECAARCSRGNGCRMFHVNNSCSNVSGRCGYTCSEFKNWCRIFTFSEQQGQMIFSDVSPTYKDVTNVAVGKTASQVSTYRRMYAQKAFDGTESTDNDFCAHTESDLMPWWKVDLMENYAVRTVRITNRNHLETRLNNFELRVGLDAVNFSNNALCFHFIGDYGKGVTRDIWCEQPVYGRYVSIQRTTSGNEPLQVCEVKVMGIGPI